MSDPIFNAGQALFFLGSEPCVVIAIEGTRDNGLRYERCYRVRRSVHGRADEFSAWEGDLTKEKGPCPSRQQ